MAGMYGCFKGRNDSVTMASGVPEVTANQEPAEIQEECSGKKKSKFQTFKKFFARKKRKEPAAAGADAALKASQSSDDVSKTSGNNTLTRAEKEKGSGSKISLGSKALSHDSVFVSDSSEANEALGASQDSIHGKVKSLQLQLKQAIKLGSPPSLMCVKRMEDGGTMSEDDGLPCSPPEYTALLAATNQAQRNSCNSLEGTDSEDEQLSYAASSRAVSPLVVPGDFSLPASPFTCLDNSAAKHKLGLRHKACNKRKPARRSEGRSLLEDTITSENEATEEPQTLQDENTDQPKPNVETRQEDDDEEQQQSSRRSLLSEKEEEEENQEEMGAEQEVSLSLDTSCLHDDEEKEREGEEEEEVSDQQPVSTMDSPRVTLEPPAGSSEMFLSSPEEENAARGADESDRLDMKEMKEMEEEEGSFLHEVLSSLKTPLSSCSLDTDHVILEQKKDEGRKEKGVVENREEQMSGEEEQEPVNDQKPSVQALSVEFTQDEDDEEELKEKEEEKEVLGEEEEKEVFGEEEEEVLGEEEEEVQQEEEENEVEVQQKEEEEYEVEVQQEEEQAEVEVQQKEEEEEEVQQKELEEVYQKEEEEEEVQEEEEEKEEEELHQEVQEEEVQEEEEEDQHELAIASEIKEKEVKEELSPPEDQIKSGEEEQEEEQLTRHSVEEKEEEEEDIKPEEEVIITQTILQAREEESIELEESEEDKDTEVMVEDLGDEDQITEMVPEEKAEDEEDDLRTKATDIKAELQGGDLDKHSAQISEDEEEEQEHSEQEETQQLDQIEAEQEDDETSSHSDSDQVEKEMKPSEEAAVVVKPSSLSLEDGSQPLSPSKTTTLQINLSSPTSPSLTTSHKVSEEEEEQVCTMDEEDSSHPAAEAELSCNSNQNKVRFTIAPAWQRSHSLSPPPSPPPTAPSGKEEEEVEEVKEAEEVVSPGSASRTGSASPEESVVIEKGNPDNPFGVRLRKTSGLRRFSSEEENIESVVELSPPENSQPVSVKPPMSLPISSKPALPKKPDIHGDGIAKLKRVSDPAAGRIISTASDSPSWISVAKQKQKIYKENSLEEITVKKEEQERKSSLPTYVSSAASREHSAKTVSQMEIRKPSADKDAKRSLSPPTPVPPQPAKPQLPPCPVAPKPQLPPATAQRSLPPSTVVPTSLQSPPCTSPPNLFKPASPVTSPQFSLRTPPEKPAVPLVQPATVQRATLPQDEPPWMALAKKKAKAWSEMPQIVQ